MSQLRYFPQQFGATISQTLTVPVVYIYSDLARISVPSTEAVSDRATTFRELFANGDRDVRSR